MSPVESLKRQHIIENNKYLYAFTLLNISVRIIMMYALERFQLQRKYRYVGVCEKAATQFLMTGNIILTDRCFQMNYR